MKKTLTFLFMALSGISFAQERPNILWMFSDDHAFQAIGAYGGRFEKLNLTPNIDRIAKNGMTFDRAYVGNSICAPSRYFIDWKAQPYKWQNNKWWRL